MYQHLVVVYQYLQEVNFVSTLFRLLLATVAATIIGMDRSRKGRAAGVKTHILVSLGSTLVMLTSQYMYGRYGVGDIGRMGAQVISGIGFLGVGTIIVTSNNKVKGLTTAAGLWTMACIGLAIGIGFYEGAFAVCLIMIFVIKFLSRIEWLIHAKTPIIDLYIGFQKNSHITKFIDDTKKQGYKIISIEILQAQFQGKKQPTNALVSIHIGSKENHDGAIDFIQQMDGIISVEEY